MDGRRKAPLLHTLVDEKKFGEATKRASSHQNEAKYCDIGGFAPLHLVCQNKNAPLHLVDALLSAHPGAVAHATTFKMEIPLHVASVKSSVPVLERLVRANFASIDARDKKGMTASQRAWRRLISLAHRRGSASQTSDERRNYRKKYATVEAFLPEMQRMLLHRLDDDLTCLWENVSYLCKVEYYRTTENPLEDGMEWSAMHACVGMSDTCYSDLLQFSVMADGAAGLDRAVDEQGNLPLHAVSRLATLDPERNSVGEIPPVSNIDVVLNGLPVAARKQNEKGELPFHVAIKTGVPWGRGLESIFSAHPDAISAVDGVTGLCPFVLAAETSSTTVDTLYNLLLVCPELHKLCALHPWGKS